MAGGTKIEWTEETWNPIVGCTVVSKGCTNCYAMKMAGTRLDGNPNTPHYAGTTMKTKAGPVWTGKVAAASESTLLTPLRWKRPRRIFVNSMGDLFHEGITNEQIDRVFAVMALCPQHTFQVLTKRPERMREYMLSNGPDGQTREMCWAYASADQQWPDELVRVPSSPLRNVWLGVSVEDQATANERIPILLDTPAAIRFISAEPLLGPLDLTSLNLGTRRCQIHPDTCNALNGEREAGHGEYEGIFDLSVGTILDWVIVGGESGPNARPMHPDWARALRDQCAAASVPFFFKQWGDWLPIGQFYPDEPVYGPHGVLSPSGTFLRDACVATGDGDSFMFRIGKKRAGNLLDGVQHHNWPEVR